jgi:hypothetical protein
MIIKMDKREKGKVIVEVDIITIRMVIEEK